MSALYILNLNKLDNILETQNYTYNSFQYACMQWVNKSPYANISVL